MKNCKVFGVSCDEFLDFATDNRLEWASKGKAIVEEWAKTIEEDCEEDLKRAKSAKKPLPSFSEEGRSSGEMTEISV